MSLKVVFNPITGKFDMVERATDAMAPVFIPSGRVFRIPRYKQCLYNIAIDAEGVIDGDGVLVEVD